MRSLPPLATQDRVFGAVLVVGCGIGQAVALAIAAFATRDAFAALHAAASLEPGTVIALATAGVMAALFLFVARRQGEALGQSYAMSLRAVLYEAIAHLPKSRHAERRLGALSLRFVGDLSAARLWFGRVGLGFGLRQPGRLGHRHPSASVHTTHAPMAPAPGWRQGL